MRSLDSWKIGPALLLAYVLQTTWLAHLTFWGVHCDLGLMVAVSAALLGGVEQGAWAGFGAGLLLGFGSNWHPGSFIVSHAVAGAVIGFIPRKLSFDNPFAPTVCALMATVVADFVFLVMSPTDFPLSWWLRHVGVSCLLHAVAIVPVHIALFRLVPPPRRMMFG